MTDHPVRMWPSPAEVVILAGGASQRMGSPKALLRFSSVSTGRQTTAPETFLDHIIAVYRSAGVARATVVWSEPMRRDPRILHYISHPGIMSLKITHEFHDDPQADRMASVIRGLRRADSGSSIFLQDVDRPFITPSVLRQMLACGLEDGYAAPDVCGRAGHPLLLSPTVVSTMLRESSAGLSLTLRDVLQPFPCTLVSVGNAEAALLEININTPEEYRRYFGQVQSRYLTPATASIARGVSRV